MTIRLDVSERIGLHEGAGAGISSVSISNPDLAASFVSPDGNSFSLTGLAEGEALLTISTSFGVRSEELVVSRASLGIPAVRNVSFSGGTESIQASWDRPERTGVNGVRVRIKESEDAEEWDQEIEVSTRDTTAAFTGLPANTSHFVSLAYFNSVGEGPASTSFVSTTQQSAGEPSGFRFGGATATRIVLLWDPPESGGRPHEYFVRISSVAFSGLSAPAAQRVPPGQWGPWMRVAAFDSRGAPAPTRAALTGTFDTGAGKGYFAQIYARNDQGASPAVRIYAVLADVPSIPLAPTASISSARGTTATLNWTRNASGGQPAKWVVEHRVGTGAWTSTDVSGSATRSHVITGLSSGDNLQARVAGVIVHGGRDIRGEDSNIATAIVTDSTTLARPPAPSVSVRTTLDGFSIFRPSAVTGGRRWRYRYRIGTGSYTTSANQTGASAVVLVSPGVYSVQVQRVADGASHEDSEWSEASGASVDSKLATPPAPTLSDVGTEDGGPVLRIAEPPVIAGQTGWAYGYRTGSGSYTRSGTLALRSVSADVSLAAGAYEVWVQRISTALGWASSDISLTSSLTLAARTAPPPTPPPPVVREKLPKPAAPTNIRLPSGIPRGTIGGSYWPVYYDSPSLVEGQLRYDERIRPASTAPDGAYRQHGHAEFFPLYVDSAGTYQLSIRRHADSMHLDSDWSDNAEFTIGRFSTLTASQWGVEIKTQTPTTATIAVTSPIPYMDQGVTAREFAVLIASAELTERTIRISTPSATEAGVAEIAIDKLAGKSFAVAFRIQVLSARLALPSEPSLHKTIRIPAAG